MPLKWVIVRVKNVGPYFNSLSGQAIAAVESLLTDVCASQNYPTLRENLNKYVGIASTHQVRLLRLLSRKQSPDESLNEYANSIRAIAAVALPGDPEVA